MSAAAELTASCACGQVRVCCAGESILVSLFACAACRRRTGGPFGVAALFEEANAASEGATRVYTRPSDSGHQVARHFCANFGSTVFWPSSRKPGCVAVAWGAFADPAFPAPSQAVNEAGLADWCALRLGPAKAP